MKLFIQQLTSQKHQGHNPGGQDIANTDQDQGLKRDTNIRWGPGQDQNPKKDGELGKDQDPDQNQSPEKGGGLLRIRDELQDPDQDQSPERDGELAKGNLDQDHSLEREGGGGGKN